MLAPVSRLRKQDIVWLARHRCRHYHSYLEHYSCYLEENPHRVRIGFFDIEASNLSASFGIMLSYCIKVGGKKEILHGVISKKDLGGDLDKRIVEKCVKDLSTFDRVVTFYGKRFDFPFLRTRAVTLGVPFFNYGELIHEDVYFNIREKFKLHSNRLEQACRTLLGKTDKTHITPEYWIKALQGDKRSLDYILTHNKYDVKDLEKLYNKVYSFKMDSHSSI